MKRLWSIARMGFWLGATIFGGLNAAYPAMRVRSAELEADITPQQVDGLYALAVLLPGPSFLNLWGAICVQAGGVAGLLVGELALLLPAFMLVLLLPLTSHIAWIGAHGSGALHGATWGTAGLLIATGIESVKQLKRPSLRVVAGLALAALLLGLHPIMLLILVMGWGVGSAVLPKAKEGAA